MTDTHVRALLAAALAATAVRSAFPYQPKDLGALPMLSAGDRAAGVLAEDESAVLLARTATVTFYLVTPAKDGFAGSDAAYAALEPVYEDAGWRYVRDRQLEATWGDRDVIVLQLFLSRST